jgi:hypothetical protein
MREDQAMASQPETFECVVWEAAATGNLSCEAKWSVVHGQVRLMPADDRQVLFLLLGEDSVRRSIDETANQVVLGALLHPQRAVAFGANRMGEVVRMWATRVSRDQLYPLLRRWAKLADIPEWRTRESGDQGFVQGLRERSDVEPPSGEKIIVSVPPLEEDDESIGLHDPNQATRLLKCYKLALNMLEAQYDHEARTSNEHKNTPATIVLVDNLSAIPTNQIVRIAGLRSVVNANLPGWRIIDESRQDLPAAAPSLSAPTECPDAERAEQPSSPPQRLRESPRPVPIADLHELKSMPRHDSIGAFCDAVGRALVEYSNRSVYRDLDALEAAVFRNPAILSTESIHGAQPAWMEEAALSAMIRAVIVARNPAVALSQKGSFWKWLSFARKLDLVDRMSNLVVAAQAAHDYVARNTAPLREQRCFRLLLGAVEGTLEPIERVLQEVVGGSDGSLWHQQPHTAGLIEVMDRLAELQIGCDQRCLLRAQALMRMALAMPTPDVVVRAVHLAMDAAESELDALVARALSCASPLMLDLAVAVIAERSACELTRAREILCERFCPSAPMDRSNSQPRLRTLASAL